MIALFSIIAAFLMAISLFIILVNTIDYLTSSKEDLEEFDFDFPEEIK